MYKILIEINPNVKICSNDHFREWMITPNEGDLIRYIKKQDLNVDESNIELQAISYRDVLLKNNDNQEIDDFPTISETQIQNNQEQIDLNTSVVPQPTELQSTFDPNTPEIQVRSSQGQISESSTTSEDPTSEGTTSSLQPREESTILNWLRNFDRLKVNLQAELAEKDRISTESVLRQRLFRLLNDLEELLTNNILDESQVSDLVNRYNFLKDNELHEGMYNTLRSNSNFVNLQLGGKRRLRIIYNNI